VKEEYSPLRKMGNESIERKFGDDLANIAQNPVQVLISNVAYLESSQKSTESTSLHLV